MKVNIIGKVPGQFVSGIGILPVYGKELGDDEIKRLLNFGYVKVYDATTGGLITKNTFAKQARAAKKPTIKKPAAPTPVVETKPYTPAEVVVEPTPVEPAIEVPMTVTEAETTTTAEVAEYTKSVDTVDGVDEISPAESTNDDEENEPIVAAEPEETKETNQPYPYRKHGKKHRDKN